MTKRTLRSFIGFTLVLGVLLLAVPMASADLYAGLPSAMPGGAGPLPTPVVMQPVQAPVEEEPGVLELIMGLKPFLFGLPF